MHSRAYVCVFALGFVVCDVEICGCFFVFCLSCFVFLYCFCFVVLFVALFIFRFLFVYVLLIACFFLVVDVVVLL